ncbi:hypothetical protein GCM10009716_47620 [Streptomyces sodiiphilus]|uniref:Uncharacterized protein n=1 Tax=Streptomyces sodiiphilus TaxID=226217 RepID=A0ABP5B7C7_9ACTN
MVPSRAMPARITAVAGAGAWGIRVELHHVVRAAGCGLRAVAFTAFTRGAFTRAPF